MIKITGQVQGVGFRPFIYRLAHKHHLTGWVNNRSGEVLTLVQGKETTLRAFQNDVLQKHPPLAKPEITLVEEVENENLDDFVIARSATSDNAERHIPPDYFTCNDCLEELTTPEERRYRYPFINCTQCGPRYTIIADLPYDRPNTSLRDFPLCPDCHKEYTDTLDRRFHAQPLACAECGPHLSFHNALEPCIEDNEAALAAAIDVLRQGKILAVKGLGGYHLMCDAANNDAVLRLRHRKHRPDKPLAVMFSHCGADGLEQVRQYCSPTDAEAQVISSAQRPIVLVKVGNPPQSPFKKGGSKVMFPLNRGGSNEESTIDKRESNEEDRLELAEAINPGLDEIGVMLAYSPLHYLLLNDFGAPLVATSGNLSGEPVLTANDESEERLAPIADAFLQHNRPILRPADDTVVRVIAGKQRLFRIGRGMAPLEITLPLTLKQPVLATGGQMKNTIALAWHNRVVISPHIGELDTRRSIEIFQQVIDDLCQLYRIKPERIICDAHPDYYSSRYARQYAERQQIPLTRIQHHKAHAGMLCGEFSTDITEPWLVFSWDGTGLGDDQTIWGGEAFYGHAGNWQRLASIRPFYLQGGDKAAREPWRSACALLWETGQHDRPGWQPERYDSQMAFMAWQKRLNTIQCSSMGRLFDAASALLSLGEDSSFEGQGPMQLEALLESEITPTGQLPLPLYQQDGLYRADWSELLVMLTDPDLSQSQRSAVFHERIAETLIAQAQKIRQLKGAFKVGLSGGVFQNKHLSEYILKRLKQEKFQAHIPEKIPCNDAGLSFGQIIEGSLNEQQ